MGNSSSEPELSQEEKDIRRLADRFPFGDEEFQSLYRAYHSILLPENRNVETSSFLKDWAEASGLEKVLMEIVETKILTADFGNRLYRTSFLLKGDSDLYDIGNRNNEKNNGTTTDLVDEFTRTSRLEKVFEGFARASRKGSKHSTQVMFDACQKTLHPTRKKAIDFVSQGYRLALATAFLQAEARDDDMSEFIPEQPPEADVDNAELRAFAKSIVERAHTRRSQMGLPYECPELDQGLVEVEDVQDWVEQVAPLYASILQTFLFEILFPGKPYPPSRTAFDFPKVPSPSDFFPNSRCPILFKLACMSIALEGSYFRLYASSNDGLSFNRLQNALLGYSGPTLLIVRAVSGAIFGAFTASAWKESKDFYGNTDCFLFSLSPVTAVYRPSGNQRNYMYCNSFARSRGYDRQAHGIGFGGSVDEPRLFLTESFDDCRAGARDLTFENGSLLPPLPSGAQQSTFEIDVVEVWGVGGDQVVADALDERQKARALKEEGIRRARKVDKAQFLDDFRSGVIDSKAFKHRQEIDGRADEDCKDRWNKNKYDYEK